ncbi:hypothetical protein N0V82_006506 [Gnomoniopsis sp. IMI 355080]|nr:hypothetical protein N0V82_006506 [Gnomoniopsis sp. IMI 355080]
MASQSASEMAKEASSSSGKFTLQSVLSVSRQSLATIQTEQMALKQHILDKVQDVNQTFTDYWIAQAKNLQHSLGNAGRDVDGDEWQVEFATQETARAKAAAAKQKELWSQIEVMVKKAKDGDDKFWATWQNSLDHFGASNESTRQPLPSQGPRKSHEPGRAKHLTVATENASAPTAPITATAEHAPYSPLRKYSDPETTAKPSALSVPSGSNTPAGNVKDKDKSNHLGSLASSSHTALGSSSSRNREIKNTTHHEKKNRPTRRATAKSSIKSSPVITSRPVKKRVSQQKAKSPINPHPVTDPRPGQLYQAYYHSTNVKERGWYMGTVLPWKSSDWAEETMINFSMRDLDLLSEWPECCEPGFETKTYFVNGNPVEVKELTCIKRWMPDFEDDGPRVKDRKFLFLFFEDRPKRLGCLSIDPTQPMSLIQFNPTGGEPVPIDWVDAKHLRMNVDDGTPVWGSCTAEKYRNKLDHVARLRQQARVVSTSINQQDFGAQAGATESTVAFGLHQVNTGGGTGEQPLDAGFNHFKAMTEGPSGLPLGNTQVDRQQNSTIPLPLSTSSGQVPSGQRPSTAEQANSYPNALSPAQTDIDEAYEEPQTYTTRTGGKRSLSNDDQYDEGLGMDYDLHLTSATQMSRPRTSIMGPPPHKLPRLADYNIPGASSSGSGMRSPNASYMNAHMSNSRPGSTARFPITPSSTAGHVSPSS